MYLWKVIIFYCSLQVITSAYLPMIVREANTNDNQGLLDLNRKTPMKGYLQVRIDRDQDFFEVTRRRGEEYYTFVVEDENRIIACWSIVKHPVFVNGSKSTLNYIRDLKLDPDYQGSLAVFRLFKYSTDFQKKRNADLHFAIALKGNWKVLSMVGGRAGLSKFELVGKFYLNFFLLASRRINLENYILESDPDPFELSDFYGNFYNRYQLGPVITSDHLGGRRNIVLKQNNQLIAAATLEDPIEYRKIVVVKYSWFLKCLLVVVWVLSKLGLSAKAPRPGGLLKILFIKYIAHSNSPVGLRKLIQYILSQAYAEGYHFVCLGLDKMDPLRKHLKGFLRIKVGVLGFATSLQGNSNLIEILKEGILFEDHPLS